MKTIILMTVLSVLIAGCASPQMSAQPPVAVAAHRPGLARVTVRRNSDLLYLLLSARVAVNGAPVGSLSRGDVLSTEIEPGALNIVVDTATAPGQYRVSGRVEADKEYVFDVSPRPDSFAPGVALGALGLLIDAEVNQNSGLFMISLRQVYERQSK